MSAYIFRVQIAPVQAFISASRKTADLYYSSRILSEVVRAGVEEAQRHDARLLFPVLVDGALPESIPNVFSFILDAADDAAAKRAGEAVSGALRRRWHEMASAVADYLEGRVGSGKWRTLFDAQIARYLEVYWVALPYQAADHAQRFTDSVKALSARKLLRQIAPFQNEGAGRRKCTLTGAMEALPIDWRRFDEVTVRPNEALGAVAALKRFAREASILDGGRSFDDLESVAQSADGTDTAQYVALLHMDGDRMGSHISGLDQAGMKDFTATLSSFAHTEVPALFGQYDSANLVYSGGDDVLGFVSPKVVLELAAAVRNAFQRATGKTMSAGIALMPLTYPLDLGLEMAREAEKAAKQDYGRDAVCVIEVHGGQKRQAGAKWDQLDAYHALVEHFRNGKLSSKLGYQLRQMADEMGGSVPVEARRLELRRLLSRRAGSDLSEAEVERLTALIGSRMEELGDILGRQQEGSAPHLGCIDMANWAVLARFMSKRSG
jgi:hypothetical protein